MIYTPIPFRGSWSTRKGSEKTASHRIFIAVFWPPLELYALRSNHTNHNCDVAAALYRESKRNHNVEMSPFHLYKNRKSAASDLRIPPPTLFNRQSTKILGFHNGETSRKHK